MDGEIQAGIFRGLHHQQSAEAVILVVPGSAYRDGGTFDPKFGFAQYFAPFFITGAGNLFAQFDGEFWFVPGSDLYSAIVLCVDC